MIDPTHQLPVTRQALVLKIARSTVYYKPTPVASEDLALMSAMDRLHLDYPFAGARMLRDMLTREGYEGVGRRRIRRLMKCIGIEALYRKPNTSKRHPQHRIYPYLLRNLLIDRPNQVWAMDITYLPMKKGFLYLVAVLDWNTRKVLSHRLSNTMHADFCIEALDEAVIKYGRPEIMNTDQGSQFTSFEFTQTLRDHGIQISMDGRGCWRDNVFIERFWRTIKYEEVYMRAYETTSEARGYLGRYIDFYNQQRPHSSLGGQSPDNIYFSNQSAALAA
jgi:putative transposase